ncbi:F420-non-reducing hydrogenase small subunit [Desulfitispora alkaliphila]|uniref:NADH-quinone oxidoreductase subunit B family protein n=1 Tax=Desulfitispora alkaliphila TaxID=622674 RepID=UPI003D2337AC
MAKLKVAVYWAADCGGCGVALLDINEKIIDLGNAADIVFFPLAADGKVADVQAMQDGEIDLCLFSGAIRNSENREMAELLRAKSKVLIAFGSCACFGGIPSLGNFHTKEEILNRVFVDNISTNNPEKLIPKPKFNAPEGELELPEFYNHVYFLDQVIDVDYFMPGCPPVPDTIWGAIELLVGGQAPPRRAIIAGEKTLCDECSRVKEEKKISQIKLPSQVNIDAEKCLLEQGIICCGPATRGGCNGRCTSANMPCRGCYGPSGANIDQGGKLVGAIASIIDSDDPKIIREITAQIIDPAGTFYRFTLAASMLKGKRREGVSNEKANYNRSNN